MSRSFAYDGALLSGARLAVTLRYVTNQQEKLILCNSLSIQFQKHCYIIYQSSWQPEKSVLSMLPPSTSVSMIVPKTCATLWEVLQPVPNKAVWETFSTVSAVSALCGVCADVWGLCGPCVGSMRPLSGRSAPHLPYVFVGDDAFPLQRNFMRPYPGELIFTNRSIFHC